MREVEPRRATIAGIDLGQEVRYRGRYDLAGFIQPVPPRQDAHRLGLLGCRDERVRDLLEQLLLPDLCGAKPGAQWREFGSDALI